MSVTPDFIGQRYKDTNTGNIWIANSTTPGDWTLELQNARLGWTPTTLNLDDQLGIVNYGTLAGITSISFGAENSIYGYDIESSDNLQSVSFPNLITVDPSGLWGGLISLRFNDVLQSVSFPLLTTFGGPGLTFYIDQNPLLTSITLPAFLPLNGYNCDFRENALNAATINNVLARCVANPAYVSGQIKLQGGTNAAPSGQGIADKATLIGRGVSVTTN